MLLRRFVSHLAPLAPLALLAACSAPGPRDGGADASDGSDAPVVRCVTDTDCSDSVYCNGAERCTPSATNADARGCVPANPATPCMQSQTCDEAADRCVTTCSGVSDADGDGHRSIDCGGDDCDDADANRFPGNTEICEWDAANSRRIDPTHDEDCNSDTIANPVTLDGDLDHDTYVDVACCNARRAGGMTCGNDCADTTPVMGVPATFMMTVAPASIHPTQIELCNGIDDNCSGAVDEGLAPMTFYADCDGDGFGDAAGAPLMSCAGSGVERCSGNEAVSNNTDCDDTRASVHRGATEACNAVDDNCDGVIDEGLPGIAYYRDCDGDGYGDQTDTGTTACAPGIAPECMMHPAIASATDCDDTRDTVHPSTSEVCNGRDEDCNGRIDTGCPSNISVPATASTSPLLGMNTSSDTLTVQRCPAGQIVVGFRFHESTGHIDGITVKCQSPSPGHSGDPYAYEVTSSGSISDFTPVAGTAVGTYTDAVCPAGYVGRGFRVNNFFSGTFGSPGMECVHHPITGSIGSWSVDALTDTRIVPSSGTGNPTVCGSRDLMVGANIYWDSASVHGIEILCVTPTVGLLP